MDFDQLTPFQMFGVNPGGATAAASGGGGEALPSVSAQYGDHGMNPLHPDSPVFWVAILSAATLLGIIGASLDVRAGKRHASVKVGD